MATGTTANLALSTVEANDQLPEAVVKANFEVLDLYVAATSLTNKSGAQVVAGDVVVADTTTNSSFTTTTTAGYAKVVGVAQATIANNAAGIVKHHGKSSVNVTGATSRGDWLTTSTTAGQAVASSAASAPVGAFAIALTSSAGAGTVTALLISPATLQSLTRTIDIPAFSMTGPAANAAADGAINGTNHDYRTKDYDQTTEEHAVFEVAVPSTYTGGNITWKFYWTAAAGTGGVAWEVNVASMTDDGVFDAAKTDVGSATDTLIATGDLHIATMTQSTSLPTAGGVMTVTISRDVADAADTLNADARLIRAVIVFPDSAN